MMKLIIIIFIISATALLTNAQNINEDFLVNILESNNQGLGKTSIAAHSNGNFAVAWQDYNDYSNAITEQPRIAVQMFSNSGNKIGQINLFQGETRNLSIWTSDFLDENSDVEFMPDGTLLVAVEHEGRFSIGGDDIGSSEIGIGAVNSSGIAIDISNENGIIDWLISTETKWLEHPRISVGKNGDFILVADGATYTTAKRAVIAQVYNVNGSLNGDLFTPHISDLDPQVNHKDPDVATNGATTAIVWQDGRNGNDWDISVQFYNNSGPIGNNLIVHSNDPLGTINVLPSIAMNEFGESIIVWLDTRDNPNGEVYAQRFNASGQKLGGNIKISEKSGIILDRPEVALLNNGNFMVVWSDNRTNSSDLSGNRALGRQFSIDGFPITDVLIIPNTDVPSGFIDIATDGQAYYCSWLDDRLNTPYLNVFAKRIVSLTTSVNSDRHSISSDYILMQNYPNPFNPSTSISYSLPNEAHITLAIYGILGNTVAVLENGYKSAGTYAYNFDASNLPAGRQGLTSGIYFYTFRSGNFVETKKMLLMK